MLKKLLVIIILSISIYCAYNIYLATIANKIAYRYEYPFRPHFYLEEPIVIDEDFEITDILHVFSNEYSYLQERNENCLDITLSNNIGKNNRTFAYQIKEKEKEIKYVFVTRYVNANNQSPPVSNENNNPSNSQAPSNDEPYFNGYHDIEIPLGTSIEELANILSKDIRTSVKATVDYSEVQLDNRGVYKVTYLTEIGNFTINLTIV